MPCARTNQYMRVCDVSAWAITSLPIYIYIVDSVPTHQVHVHIVSLL